MAHTDLVIKLIEGGASGLYNVGTEKKSIYQLAKRTKEDVKEIFSPPHVPKDISMNLSKMEKFLLNLYQVSE